MMRDHVWTWDHTECAWQSRPFKGRQVKRREGKGKGKGKGRPKRTGRAFFGDEQAQDPEWWQEEHRVWWSKGKKGHKGLSKSNDGFRKGGFRPYPPDKGASKDFPQNKGRRKDQKGKGNEGTCPQSGFSASETPNEEGYGQACESDDWSASHWTYGYWTPHAEWFCRKTFFAWMVETLLNLASHPRTAIKRFKKHAWY